jgi:hypothetical protein
MRLIIMSCSGRKRSVPDQLPALLRYDGVAYRTIWSYLARRTVKPRAMLASVRDGFAPHQMAAVQEWCGLDVLILSAEFGFITATTPIPMYDRRMTPQRAQELRANTSTFLVEWLTARRYERTLVMLGSAYRAALDLVLVLQQPPAALGVVTVTTGGIGVQLGQLARWLRDDPENTTPTTPPICSTCGSSGTPGSFYTDNEGARYFLCAPCEQCWIDEYETLYAEQPDDKASEDVPF